MDRRSFLTVAGAGLTGVGTGLTAAGAASSPGATTTPFERPRLEFRSVVEKACSQLPGMAQAISAFAHHLATVSGGDIALSTATFGDVSSRPTPDASIAHAVFGGDLFRIGQHPGYAFFGGMLDATPLALATYRHWLEHGPGQELHDELAGAYGTKSLPIAALPGTRLILRRDAAGPAGSLRGLRIATCGLGVEVAGRLGSTPVNWLDLDGDPADHLNLLTRGLIDGFDAFGPSDVQFEFAPLEGCIALPSALAAERLHVTITFPLATWNTLRATDRAALIAAARATWETTFPAIEPVQTRLDDETSATGLATTERRLLDEIRTTRAAALTSLCHGDQLAERIGLSYGRHVLHQAVLTGKPIVPLPPAS